MSKKDFEKIDAKLTRDLRKMELRTWKSYQDRIPELQAYLAKLYGKSDTIPVSRVKLTTTTEEMNAITTGLYADLFADINEDLRNIYAGSFDDSAGIFNIAVNQQFKLDALEKAMKAPVAGLTLDLRLEAYEMDLRNKLIQQVVTGSAQGKTLPELLDGIDTVFGKDAGRVKRILVTESHRKVEEAKFDALSNDAKTKTWETESDGKVRPAHVELNGVTIPVDEEFTVDGASAMFPGGFGVAELDIECRCWLTYNK